jgi:hypothetical protein
MVESMRRQGFACLRGGRRTEKGGFKNRAAAPHKSHKAAGRTGPFIAGLPWTRSYVNHVDRIELAEHATDGRLQIDRDQHRSID